MACSFPRLIASNNHSPQLARQFSSKAEYMDEIHLLPGSEHSMAIQLKFLAECCYQFRFFLCEDFFFHILYSRCQRQYAWVRLPERIQNYSYL